LFLKDFLNDDFDLKNVLKIKTQAPNGISVTTAADINCGCGGKASSVGAKITTKWAHESGFAIDKFEMKSNGGLAIETSLTGVAPNLKFEFKGDDSNKADLGAVYKHEFASVTAEVDVAEFSCAKATILGGNSTFTAGASTVLSLGDKFDVKSFDVSASYKLNDIFAGLKVSNKFTQYGVSLSYLLSATQSLFGTFTLNQDSTTSGVFGASYKCNPKTTLKAKVCTGGNISASVKQNVEKTCSVVGAVQIPISDISASKYGITITLG